MPGKSHGRRILEGCSPWGHWGSDTTEWLHFHFHFHALEKEMATQSSVLAWRIPGTGEPRGLPSMRSHRVGHDWSDLAAAVVHASHNSKHFMEIKPCNAYSHQMRFVLICHLLFKSFKTLTAAYLLDFLAKLFLSLWAKKQSYCILKKCVV